MGFGVLFPEAGDKFWSHPGERNGSSKLLCPPCPLPLCTVLLPHPFFPGDFGQTIFTPQKVPMLSLTTFPLIVFKVLGTLETLQRLSSGASLSMGMVFFLHQRHSGTGAFINF